MEGWDARSAVPRGRGVMATGAMARRQRDVQISELRAGSCLGRRRTAMLEVLRREAERRGVVLEARREARGSLDDERQQRRRTPAARAMVAAREAGAASLRRSDGYAGGSVRDERDWRADPITGGVVTEAQATEAARWAAAGENSGAGCVGSRELTAAAQAERAAGGLQQQRSQDAGWVARRRDERMAHIAETRPVMRENVVMTARQQARVEAKLSERDEILEGIRDGRRDAMACTLSESTHGGVDSAVRLWFEFCAVRGRDPYTFGRVEEDAPPRPSQLMEEDEAFCEFAVYVCRNPRIRGKDHLLGKTAGQYVGRVMTWYEGRLQPARRPGSGGSLGGASNALGLTLRRTLKGLRKLHPSDPKKGRKTAVLRRVMMGIRRQLDLHDKFDAMVWAFACTAWQGGRRSGELVRGKARKGPWDPKRDMHRGRVSVERHEDGRPARVVIALAPDKTDPTGEEGHEAILPWSSMAEINAAAAIMRMIELDPTEPGVALARVPLFRDTRPGREGKAMTYGSMMLVMRRLMVGAGMTPEEAGAHSFRRGCATSLLHIGASDATSRAVGIWASNAMYGYMDVACGGAMEQAMLAMAEADTRVRPAASGRGID